MSPPVQPVSFTTRAGSVAPRPERREANLAPRVEVLRPTFPGATSMLDAGGGRRGAEATGRDAGGAPGPGQDRPAARTRPRSGARRLPRLGLIDTLLGLAVVDLTFNLSLVIWMMRPFFDGLPRSLEEAAAIDGAGPLPAFLRITLLLAGPGLATIAIFWTRSRTQMGPG